MALLRGELRDARRRHLLSFYGLKWNPFTPDVPVEALRCTRQIEHFARRVEQMVADGGFGVITGKPGTGKSTTLRLLADRLARLPDVDVGVIDASRCRRRRGRAAHLGVVDFYWELGGLFNVKISPSNRRGGFKALRERWKAHLDSTPLRPVLLIDEAPHLSPAVLPELRILSGGYLTVVLSGPSWWHNSLTSHICTRLGMGHASRAELLALLKHAVTAAGNDALMSDELMQALAERADGNYRAMMSMAGALLVAGLARKQAQLDEQLYLDVLAATSTRPSHARSSSRTRRWATSSRYSRTATAASPGRCS